MEEVLPGLSANVGPTQSRQCVGQLASACATRKNAVGRNLQFASGDDRRRGSSSSMAFVGAGH